MTRGVILAFTLWLGGAFTNFFFTGLGWLAILIGIAIFFYDQRDGFQKKDVAKAAPIVLIGIALLLVPAIVKPLRVEREERRLAVEILNDEKEVLNREGYRKTEIKADSLYCVAVDAVVDSVECWYQHEVFRAMDGSSFKDSTKIALLSDAINNRHAWQKVIGRMVDERPSAPWTARVRRFIREDDLSIPSFCGSGKALVSGLADSTKVDVFIAGLLMSKRPTAEQLDASARTLAFKLGFDTVTPPAGSDSTTIAAIDPDVIHYVGRLMPLLLIFGAGIVVAISFNTIIQGARANGSGRRTS